MTWSDVEVRESAIQGRGLYARRAFMPGEIVLRWDTSHTILKEEWSSLPEDEKRYTHPLDDQNILIVQAPERFVNHSCGSNTEVRDFCDVAVKPIAAGDEITSDYGVEGASASFECLCGSNDCRGFVGLRQSYIK